MNIEKLTKALLVFAISFLIATTLFFLWATAASAQDERGWLPRRWQNQHQRHLYSNPRFREPQRYYKAIEEASIREAKCLERRFSDKGREFNSEEAALKDAERSWGALIREERGEKYMDLKFAKRYESRCQRSSTGESLTARAVDSITGGASGTLYRCRVYAEPCMAPRVSGEDGK